MSRILVIESDSALSKRFGPVFSGDNIALQPVANTDELMTAVGEGEPELILISADLKLNGQNGDDSGYQAVCKALKAKGLTEQIPLVVLDEDNTVAVEEENRRMMTSLECGASDHIFLLRGDAQAVTRLKFAMRNRRAIAQAQGVARQLNQLNEEIYQRNLQVEKDLNTTRQLQQSLLPPPVEDPSLPQDPLMEFQFSKCHYVDEYVRVCGLYVPSDALGGDLYDVMDFKNGSVGVTIADVSGHGVPAGFITAIYKASLYRATNTLQLPGEILFSLNNELANIIKTGDYITSIYCRLLENGRKLEYSGAGHPYPILYRKATGAIERLAENGPPLVWFKDMDYPLGTVELERGDKLLLFTDGISEMKNPARQIFTEEALESLFASLIDEPGTRMLDRMVQSLSDYTEGHPLEDDVSVALIEVL